MKTQTAVQEIINIIKADLFFAKTKKDIKYLNNLLDKLKRKEEKEKQQIIDAYVEGFKETVIDNVKPEQYYNSTFKQD